MDQRCTCGAQLYPDALFCHKCGKPTRELMASESEAPAEPPPLPPASRLYVPDPALEVPRAAAVPVISFGNRQAVRSTMLVAALAWLLMTIPWPIAPFFWVLWLLAAGFVAVWLYHKRTGESPNLRNGVRLGWLTGVFCFVISLVFIATSVVAVNGQGGIGAVWRRQIRESAAPGMNVEEALQMLESPAGVFFVLVFVLLILFMFFTALPMIGGALGAKVLEKE